VYRPQIKGTFLPKAELAPSSAHARFKNPHPENLLSAFLGNISSLYKGSRKD
jgi:hypothetical protein